MIHQVKELKMTKVCETCQDQYGLWRHHCPCCGTANKDREKACAAPTKSAARPGRATIRERVEAKGGCIFCHAPKAKETCPHCNERVHRNCLHIHAPTCAAFQIERQRAEARLQEGATT